MVKIASALLAALAASAAHGQAVTAACRTRETRAFGHRDPNVLLPRAFDRGLGLVELLVFASDRETGQLLAANLQSIVGVLEPQDRALAAGSHAFKDRAGVLDLFAIGQRPCGQRQP